MYRFMDEQEIEIRQIDNLKMVNFYDLATGGVAAISGANQGAEVSGNVPALAIYYGDNKQINLCAMDTHYNLLMERVLTLYSQCEDKNSIIIDDGTRGMLEKATEKGDNHTSFYERIGRKYADMECLKSPKFASEAVVRETTMPLLKYYIKNLYHMVDVDIEFEKEPLGWHSNGVLRIKRSDETFIHPMRFEFKANGCKVKIGNFLKDLSLIEFEIRYQENMLEIIFEAPDVKLYGESRFKIEAHRVSGLTTIQVAGQVVCHQNENVAALSSADQLPKSLDLDISKGRIYGLPWGGVIVLGDIESQDSGFKRNDIDIIFLEQYNGKLSVRQFSHSLVENLENGLKLRCDGANMRRLYFGPGIGEVETSFSPVGYYSGWDYKQLLENNYFYESINADSIEDKNQEGSN